MPWGAEVQVPGIARRCACLSACSSKSCMQIRQHQTVKQHIAHLATCLRNQQARIAGSTIHQRPVEMSLRCTLGANRIVSRMLK